jgi:hypothetical protein
MNMEERAKRFELARTGLNQHGKQTKNLVYEQTGVPSSALCDYENPQSKRPLSVDYVIRLAGHYGVAIDWLLGVSDSWSTKTDIRQACDVTGLSSEAVWALQELTKDEGRKAFINAFLSSPEFGRMVHAMQGMKVEHVSNSGAGVDYFSLMSRANDAGDVSFCESDYEDLKIWKASRALEAALRKYGKMDD